VTFLPPRKNLSIWQKEVSVEDIYSFYYPYFNYERIFRCGSRLVTGLGLIQFYDLIYISQEVAWEVVSWRRKSLMLTYGRLQKFRVWFLHDLLHEPADENAEKKRRLEATTTHLKLPQGPSSTDPKTCNDMRGGPSVETLSQKANYSKMSAGSLSSFSG
jgi:hypothetical protein